MNGIEHIINTDKQQIICGEICLEGQNINHDGKEGHWLETKMGIKHNTKNEPDINGYEMKKFSNKITLGDFSASEYVFSKKRDSINEINNWTDEEKIDRTNFIRTFGNPNPIKRLTTAPTHNKLCTDVVSMLDGKFLLCYYFV